MNLSTSCDVKNEKECKYKLCSFIRELQRHAQFSIEIVKKQKESSDRLWILSTKYKALARDIPNSQIYPEEISKHVIVEIYNEVTNQMEKILKKIKCYEQSYDNLEKKFKSFVKSATKLDWNINVPFIRGDERQKPLDFYMDAARDITFYFHIHQSNMLCKAQSILINDSNTILAFKDCLELDNFFIDFYTSVINYSQNCNDLNSIK